MNLNEYLWLIYPFAKFIEKIEKCQPLKENRTPACRSYRQDHQSVRSSEGRSQKETSTTTATTTTSVSASQRQSRRFSSGRVSASVQQQQRGLLFSERIPPVVQTQYGQEYQQQILSSASVTGLIFTLLLQSRFVLGFEHPFLKILSCFLPDCGSTRHYFSPFNTVRYHFFMSRSSLDLLQNPSRLVVAVFLSRSSLPKRVLFDRSTEGEER